jgi:hypothetical protein
MFTSATCLPCRIIEPVFDEHAQLRDKEKQRASRSRLSRSIWLLGWVRRSRVSSDTDVWLFLGWEEGAYVGSGVISMWLMRSVARSRVDL